MGTDTCQGKATRFGGISGAPPPPEALPCPRCDSANTKFCYYNNYNFSQPRHFCRSCRRYWTRGGTLRDVPVGGGSRKNAKRCRTTSSGAGALSPHDGFRHFPAAAPQFQGPLGVDCGGAGSFTSLLSGGPASGFLALGGVGIGDVGFGLGREVWPFTGAVGGGPTSCSVDGEGGHTWQMVNGDAMYGGDCFGRPDLAISTPGTSTSTSSSTLLLK